MDDRQTKLMTGLALVLVGLVLAIKFIEPPEEGDDEDATSDLVEISADEVERLTLVTDEGTLEAEHTLEGWLLMSPTRARGDDERLDQLVDSIDRLKAKAPMEGADPAKYGLDDPEAVLVLHRRGGGELRFELGMSSPVGNEAYVRLDGGAPRIVPGQPSRTLLVPFDGFRDRDVVSVVTSLTQRVAWQPSEGDGWSAHRAQGGWWLDDGRRANAASVEGLLGAANGMEFEGFPAGAPEDLGLEVPRAVLTIEDDAGSMGLRFGDPLMGGLVIQAPDGTVGVVGSWEGLELSWSQLLEQRLLAVPPATLSELEISLDGERSQWTASTQGWLRDDGVESGQLPSALVIELVADRELVLEPFTTETGFLRVSAGPTELRVAIGPQVEGGRVAQESAGGPPFLIPSSTLARLTSALER